MTLDHAAVDIEKSFAAGQAYVGLSRCRGPDGLQILGTRGRGGIRQACQADPNVLAFYKRIDVDVNNAKALVPASSASQKSTMFGG